MTDAIIVIPARYASERFPGKMLASETGRPLIRHVHDAAGRAACAERVIVATDDQRIADAVLEFGGEVVLTRADHPNGTSRIAEVVETLGLTDDRIVVNVQGDEPEIEPGVIDAAATALAESGTPMATVASPFAPGEDPANPNIVKVVLDAAGRALYFSRSRIPHPRDAAAAAPLKHVGLYAYRAAFLPHYVAMPQTPLERAEKLEQLRVLEHGERIAVAIRETHHHGVDTPEQYAAFVQRYQSKAAGGT